MACQSEGCDEGQTGLLGGGGGGGLGAGGLFFGVREAEWSVWGVGMNWDVA